MTNLGSGKDVLHGDGNLGPDTITLDQADEVVALFRASLVSCLEPINGLVLREPSTAA